MKVVIRGKVIVKNVKNAAPLLVVVEMLAGQETGGGVSVI